MTNLPLSVAWLAAAALVLGAAILVFLLGRARGGAAAAVAERERVELAAKLAAGEEGAKASRGEAAELRVRLDAEIQQRAASQALSVRIPELERELETRREETMRLASETARLKATLDEERRAAHEKISLIDVAEQRLSDAFKALSADALRTNNASFLELARG